MQAWFDVVAHISGRIHHHKEALIQASPTETFWRAGAIVLLESVLGILALPLYLFYNTSRSRPSFFNQKGCAYSLYRLRKRVTVSITFPILGILGIYFSLVTFVQTATITWDGGAGDGLWSSALNWSTDTVPTTTDDVVFDGTSVSDATIDAGFQGTVQSIQIQSGYTGTITPARSFHVTGSFTIANGSFLGNANTIDINGTYTQTGGIFQASNSTTSFATNFIKSGGTYLHNNGTTVFDGTGTTNYITFATSSLSTLTFANVTIAKTLTSDGIQSGAFTGAVIAVTGTLDLATGTLRTTAATATSSSVLTILEAQGPIIHRAGWAGGDGILRISGPGRTVEMYPNGYLPRVDINSTSTVVNINGTGTTTINSLNITAGTVNQNSGNILSSVSVLGPSGLYNGGTGVTQGEILFVFGGGQAIFSTGIVHIGLTVRTSNTGSLLDLSRVSSFMIRPFSSQSTVSVLGVNSGSTLLFPPIPVYISAVTSSIVGSISATNTTFIFDRNASQALFASSDITIGGLSKTATNTQNFYFPAGVTTTITGALTLQGGSTSSLLSIHSASSTGTIFDAEQARINPLGSTTVQNLNVTNNRNIASTPIDATGQYVIDNGSVDGWFGMIDITNPTTPGSLTTANETNNTVRLVFGASSTDANFLDYRIFYTLGTTTPSTSDTGLTSSTQSILGRSNYGGQTGVELEGLTRSTVYTANIWAYDEYGNTASGTTPITFATLPNPVTNIGASNIQQQSLTISWDTNNNDAATVYNITDTNDPTRTSGFFTGTSFDLVNLHPNQEYSFTIVARDSNNQENSVTVGPFTTASAGGGILVTPTPPPIGSGGGGGGGGGGGDVLNPTTPDNGDEENGDGTTPPDFSGRAMIINNDYPETLSRSVILLMNVPTAELVAISNYPDFFDAVYQPYAELFQWELTDGYGEKTVYARFLASSGGTLDASDSISYIQFEESTPPPPPPPAQTPPQTPPNPANPQPPTPPPTVAHPTPANPPQQQGGSSGGTTNPRPTPPAPQTTHQPAPPPPEPTPEIDAEPNTTTVDIATPTEEGTDVPDFPSQQDPEEENSVLQPTEQPQTRTLPATTPVAKIIETINTIQTLPEVTQAARITAPVATTISAIAVTSSLWSVVAPLVRFLFLQPLMFLGLRRREVWGEVYETENKLPVDLAIVRLTDAVSGKVVQTRVTDMHGRYLFSPKAGTYRIDVVKDGFSFPSHLLKNTPADGRHTDLYYGGPIITSTDGEPIARNIALDREGAKHSRRFRSFTQPVRALQQGMAMAGAVATSVSFVATPNIKTFGYILLHVGLGIVFFRYAKPKIPKRMGVVVDAQTKQPLAHTIVRLYNESLKKLVDTKITNEKGEYVFLVGGGSYRIIAEKPGYRSSTTPIVLPESAEAGAITKNISLVRGEVHLQHESEKVEKEAMDKSDTLPRINLMG